MTFYVTKYALTSGISKVEGKISDDAPAILSVLTDGWYENFFGEGKEWHRTIETAQARSEALRAKKIESLKRQIKQLEAKIF